MLRVGVIGIGFGQQAHVPAFRADSRCDVVAICASTAHRATRAAARFGIGQASGDWRELVRDRSLDIVAIAVPPALQPEIAVAAAEAGKHILCEKPLATTIDDAYRVATAVRAARVIAAIDLELQESDAWRTARARRQQLGTIQRVDLTWRMLTRGIRAGGWKGDPSAGGGALNGFVSHAVHGIEWLLGPMEVRRASLAPDERAAEVDFAVGGAEGRLSIATDDPAGTGHVLEVTGDRGRYVIRSTPDDYGDFELLAGNSDALESIRPAVGDGDARVRSVTSLVHRFVDAISSNEPMRPDVGDGVRIQQLLERIRAAARSGCPA